MYRALRQLGTYNIDKEDPYISLQVFTNLTVLIKHSAQMCTQAKEEQEPDEEKSQSEPPTFYIMQRLSLPTTVRFRWLGSVFTSICHKQHIQMARKCVTKQLTYLILHQWQQHHTGPFDLCSFEVGASICAPVGCQFCVQGFGIYPSAHQSALISIIFESKGFHFQHRRLLRSIFKG